MLTVAGWQWDPVDRPTFREIHIALDTMIHTSSVGEGIQFMCYLNSLFMLFASCYCRFCFLAVAQRI